MGYLRFTGGGNMTERKVVSRNVAIALGIVCIVLSATLVGTVANYFPIVKSKDDLIANQTALIVELREQLNDTNAENLALETRINQLQNQISTLESQRAMLQSQITQLESQKAALQNQIEDLENQIAALQGEVSYLDSQIQTLQAEYDRYVLAYQNLRDEVNHRWNHQDLESFITPSDPAVKNIVYSVTGGWSDPSDWNEYWNDMKALYLWVVNNIEYRHDGLYPMLPDDPSWGLDFWTEVYQFPNETLSLRQGDCEDMAMLLCSMIRCYTNQQYWAEAIGIRSSSSGHVGVQIPVSGYRLVILDPAGKYYSHDTFGNIAFNSITTEINNWLNYWKSDMGNDVYVHRVFSDYMDRPFSSTSEYISWMYSR